MISDFLKQKPISCYFGFAFLISWATAFLIITPELINGQSVQKEDGLFMFPAMIIGIGFTGIVLTLATDDKQGFQSLLRKMRNWQVKARWYLAAFFIPPVTIILVLNILSRWVSPDFSIHPFFIGILFGIPTGFFEEIGWMGYVFPKLQQKYSNFISGLLLGLAWGFWHLPVIDFLGAASPHGSYWSLYFLSFISVMSAMRVLIVWVYVNTNSVLVCQFMHASSTGFLVMLSPSPIAPLKEAYWYFAYAIALWSLVLVIILFNGKTMRLTSSPKI